MVGSRSGQSDGGHRHDRAEDGDGQSSQRVVDLVRKELCPHRDAGTQVVESESNPGWEDHIYLPKDRPGPFLE